MSNGSPCITADFCDERHGDLERRVSKTEKTVEKQRECISKIKNRINIILVLIILQAIGFNKFIPEILRYILR